MKALSIRQPWATLIVSGYTLDDGRHIFKNIENRNWLLPRDMEGQRIYVHAPTKQDSAAMEWLFEKGFAPAKVLMYYSNLIPRGALIGEVYIVKGVFESESIWFDGNYGFVLANPTAYETPIPCKGKLGFFVPDIPQEVNL